jgi:TatA/E family protein of Tat protein translocase
MFGIGPTELIVILVIALLVLGPKRLPELAAGLGKGLAEFRRATSDLNAELDEARRAVEEPAREAARAAQPDRRVSRTRGAAPTPAAVAATSEGAQSDDNDHDDEEDDPKASA